MNTVRALSIHADYGCRHTGVCCASGWPVAVEGEVHSVLCDALSDGRLRAPGGETPDELFAEDASLPSETTAKLGQDDRGWCRFLETPKEQDVAQTLMSVRRGTQAGVPVPQPALCSIHCQLGPGALPAACRHFPRVCVLTPQGVSVSLSHFCPTAAAMLFREDVDLEVLSAPPAFPADWPWEGLDAREAHPPMLRPGVLMGWDEIAWWERHMVATFAREDLSPEGALGILSSQAERLRAWSPGGEPLIEMIEGLRDESDPLEWDALDLIETVQPCIPSGVARPIRTDGHDDAFDRWVDPTWNQHARPVRRYLAARAFANWNAYQGEGLRTVVRHVAASLVCVRVHAARLCGEAQRALDDDLLREAIRASDLTLLHHADPAALTRALGACEILR